MLGKIEQISSRSQAAITENLKLIVNQSSSAYQDLVQLQAAYLQLDALIQAAKDQHATVGAFILSRQLSQSEQELNAAQLLRNFLKVLDYPVTTTFSMHQNIVDQSRLDAAKMFSMFPLIFMVAICAMFPPMLVMGFAPGLMLVISALPLAITYACDKPFSMSRFYQEMAGIEKALASSVLGLMFALLTCVSVPEITMLMIGIAFISMLSTGLALLWHSNQLQAKHEHLKKATVAISHQLFPRSSANSALCFFKPQETTLSQPVHLQVMEQTLLRITA